MENAARTSRSRVGPLDPNASLVELAYQAIRESIISGKFAPGEKLVEVWISEELGISRAPVREAFTRLTEEGLVEKHPRSGTFVREFTATDFIDLYNVRLGLEVAAVRLFIRNDASTEDLEAVVSEMEKAAKAKDASAVARIEYEFHEAICRLCGNRPLLSIYRSLGAQILMTLAIDDRGFADLAEIVEEHRALIAVLRAGDSARAVKDIQAHIGSSAEPMLTLLGGDRAALLGPVKALGSRPVARGGSER